MAVAVAAVLAGVALARRPGVIAALALQAVVLRQAADSQQGSVLQQGRVPHQVRTRTLRTIVDMSYVYSCDAIHPYAPKYRCAKC